MTSQRQQRKGIAMEEIVGMAVGIAVMVAVIYAVWIKII